MCIARVLAVAPEVILLDEPTSALDPISTEKIEEMLLTLRDNYTCIMVTHNMQQASRISDTTSFFLSGNLVESNKTKKRSEEHTSELQSRFELVCRLLLEKKN